MQHPGAIMKKNRQYNLDLIRCAAFLLVFTYHFAETVQGAFPTGVRGYDFGSLGTGLFFILSGFVLTFGMLRNPYTEKKDYDGGCAEQKESVKRRAAAGSEFSLSRFYKKRFLAIYPLYWMVFLAVYLIHGWHGGDFLYGGPVWKMLYSAAAVDGYLNLYGIQTYYVTGEWFIAVILFCYLLYPLLRKIKSSFWAYFAVTALYAANIIFGLQKGIPADASLFTGLFLFFTGMVLADLFTNNGEAAERKSLISSYLRINPAVSFLVCAVLLLIPGAGRKPLILRSLFSIALFLFLYGAFRPMKGKIGSVFDALSRYTYAAFLWHHVILSWTAGRIMNVFAFAGGFRYAAAYLGALGMTAVFSLITVLCYNALRHCCSRKEPNK